MSREQDCFEAGRAAFVMPHWMADDDIPSGLASLSVWMMENFPSAK